MNLAFEGPQPSEEELAAIVAALKLRDAGAAPRPAPWKVAMRCPELDFDELRARVRGAPGVR